MPIEVAVASDETAGQFLYVNIFTRAAVVRGGRSPSTERSERNGPCLHRPASLRD